MGFSYISTNTNSAKRMRENGSVGQLLSKKFILAIEIRRVQRLQGKSFFIFEIFEKKFRTEAGPTSYNLNVAVPHLAGTPARLMSNAPEYRLNRGDVFSFFRGSLLHLKKIRYTVCFPF